MKMDILGFFKSRKGIENDRNVTSSLRNDESDPNELGSTESETDPFTMLDFNESDESVTCDESQSKRN
jgi:hypothetical protein